jgi:hypothetical protein
MPRSVDAHWLTLGHHFVHHARQVDRFRTANEHAVHRMWEDQTNEDGEPLTQFEREALIERHCELFGVWPSEGSETRPKTKRSQSNGHNWAYKPPTSTEQLVAEARLLRDRTRQALEDHQRIREAFIEIAATTCRLIKEATGVRWGGVAVSLLRRTTCLASIASVQAPKLGG